MSKEYSLRSDGKYNVWELRQDPTLTEEELNFLAKVEMKPNYTKEKLTSRWVVVDVVKSPGETTSAKWSDIYYIILDGNSVY